MPTPPVRASAPPAGPLSLRLLGAAGVFLGGERVRVTGQTLALLAVLALDGEVERAVLADLLWSECGEDRARRNLRRELHRLQATPVHPFVERRGLRLALADGVEVDVRRVLALLDGGALGEGLARVDGALFAAGPARENAVFGAWRDAHAAHFEARVADACRAHADALERAGEVREALAVHARAVTADPLREHHHAALIRLHLALGERAEALARYAALERTLREELAIEPLPETRALAQAARTFEPPQVSAPALDVGNAFVGRHAATAVLAGAGATLIVGEPGVGKSRLAAEFARSRGPLLTLQAHEDASRLPLAPVARALSQADVRARVEALPPALRAAATRLQPGGDPAPAAPEGRLALIAGLAGALLHLAAGGTLLLEDLQWLDPLSADLTAHLLRARPDDVCIVLTARAFDLERRADLAASLAALERDGRLRRLPLDPLPEVAVHDLVRGAAGQDAPLFARWLHAATGGNALFVHETLRELHARGDLRVTAEGWSTAHDEHTVDYSELPIPLSVRDVILRRAALLGGPARRLLDAASLSASEVRAADLASVCALDAWETVEALEQAEAAQLLRVTPSGHYRFAHDLYRHTFADGVRPARRRLIHAELARVLARAGADPGRVAEHHRAAGQLAEARSWCVAAAQNAARLYEHREAFDLYGRALEGDPPPREAIALHEARLDAARFLGDEAARLVELTKLERLSHDVGDAALIAAAAVRRAVWHTERDEYAQAVEGARRTLGRLGAQLTGAARGALLLEAGAALAALERFVEARSALEEAEVLFAGDHLRRANARYWLGHCALYTGQPDAAALFTATLNDFEEVRYPRGATLSAWRIGEARAASGDLSGAVVALRDAAGRARHLRMPGLEHPIGVDLALALTRMGAWRDAWALAEDGEVDPPDAASRSGWARVRADALRARGAPGELEARARADELAPTGTDAWVLARREHLDALLRASQLQEARALLDRTDAEAPPDGHTAWRAWLRAARHACAHDTPGVRAALDAALRAGVGSPEDLRACREWRAHLQAPAQR